MKEIGSEVNNPDLVDKSIDLTRQWPILIDPITQETHNIIHRVQLEIIPLDQGQKSVERKVKEL